MNLKNSTIPKKPIWIHASSGEIEYAKPVIRELQSRYPNTPLLVTHTSLSSRKSVENLSVDAWGISPLDTPQDLKKFLNLYDPQACLIARTDLWPQTLIELSKRKIPTFLFSATVAKGSTKLSFLSRQLLKNCLPLLSQIYFVSEADKTLCEKYFKNIKGLVLGDTRYDQVLYHLQKAASVSIPSHPQLLIAGSTWEQDEKVLLPAFAQKLPQNWKMILVPHEVNSEHIEKIKNHMDKLNINSVVYSRMPTDFQWEKTDVLLVDRVGMLASLYPLAQVAFVGGSFRKQVHSVMEALAAEKPVIVGPFFENNREALEFLNLGFVAAVSDADEFAKSLDYFLARTEVMAPLLRQQIKQRTGATHRLLDKLKTNGLPL